MVIQKFGFSEERKRLASTEKELAEALVEVENRAVAAYNEKFTNSRYDLLS